MRQSCPQTPDLVPLVDVPDFLDLPDCRLRATKNKSMGAPLGGFGCMARVPSTGTNFAFFKCFTRLLLCGSVLANANNSAIVLQRAAVSYSFFWCS
jgi:hypothetical protein